MIPVTPETRKPPEVFKDNGWLVEVEYVGAAVVTDPLLRTLKLAALN